MGLGALVQAFAARPFPYARALYWIGREGSWSVHVPRADKHEYTVYRGEDLLDTLTRALAGDGGVPEKEYLDGLAPKKKVAVRAAPAAVAPPEADWGEDLI